MASIRRALSPVPQARTVSNVELCSVPSPLSKSSSNTQNCPPSTGLLSSSGAFVFGVFSPRSLRVLERSMSKQKGQLWRKVLFQFSICFMVGVSIGIIPLASMNFSIEMISAVGNFKPLQNSKINVMPSIDESVKSNATSNSAGKEQGLVDDVTYNISSSKLLSEETYLESEKLLIILTPTYTHQFQAYYLNRLAQTLKLRKLPNLKKLLTY